MGGLDSGCPYVDKLHRSHLVPSGPQCLFQLGTQELGGELEGLDLMDLREEAQPQPYARRWRQRRHLRGRHRHASDGGLGPPHQVWEHLEGAALGATDYGLVDRVRVRPLEDLPRVASSAVSAVQHLHAMQSVLRK